MKVLSMKITTVAALGAVLFALPATRASAAIIPIAITGFNEQIVVGGGPLTATMDGGVGENGASFYAQGYNSGQPTTGLVSGVSTSLTNPNATFKLGPFSQNDALLLNTNITTGTLTLATPAAYSTVSFFVASTNGGTSVNYTLNYADSTTATGTFTAADWFNGTSAALIANGRADAAGNFDSVNSGNPRIYEVDIGSLGSLASLASITLSVSNPGTSETALFAVSGSASSASVPEPASMLMLSMGVVGVAFARRRTGAA